MPDIITSSANPRIRNILKLQANSRERRKQKLFVIEGFREISRAMDSGVRLTELYYCPEIDKTNIAQSLFDRNQELELFEVGIDAFSRIAYREGSDGLIAIAKMKNPGLEDLVLSNNPLVLILESVEKPGNLGAIMRTADAAGIDAVIVCDPLTDIFNPNAIRAGVGCTFSRQVALCTADEAIKWLKIRNIKIFAAALTNEAIVYHTMDFTVPTAIVMGTEATGLSKDWLQQSDNQIIIPMMGIADSMNVSTSAAVLVYEAIRQRQTAQKH